MYQIFQEGISPVCLKCASHGDVSFKHTEHKFWQKVRALMSCIAGFLDEMCFVCLKRASH